MVWQVRAGNLTVSPDQQNSSLSTNTDCGDLDGRSTRLACCGLAGVRFVSLQVTSSSSSSLKVGKLLVRVALPLCDPTQSLASLCSAESSQVYDGAQYDSTETDSCLATNTTTTPWKSYFLWNKTFFVGEIKYTMKDPTAFLTPHILSLILWGWSNQANLIYNFRA